MKKGYGGWVCAYAHMRIDVFSENNFSQKIIFSRIKFFSKYIVVLYIINNINIIVRICVHAHMRTPIPHILFSCTYVL